MKKIIIILAAMFFTFSIVKASFFDTGYTEWSQPNGYKFTARLWGDEFESNMETQDRYKICIGSDNYYYYAVLDSNGDFKPSNRKYGIDPPLTESYNLERSSAWNAVLQQRIEAFNAQLEINYQAYLNKMASGDSVYKIGVVLIDFTPSERHRDTANFMPLGYKSAYFDSLIFSRNYWNGIVSPGNPTTPHPQNLDLFGSFADYWDDQSRGKLKARVRESVELISL